MLNHLNFNKLKKILSVVLIIFFVLPLSRCERASFSDERKLASTTEVAKSHETTIAVPNIEKPKSHESKPSMVMDFYVYIYMWEKLKKFDFDNWKDTSLSSLLLLSLAAMIFLPLGLWRVSDTRSAAILISASPAIAYGLFISVWFWPIQLLAGYLLTGIWIFLFGASLYQIYLFLRKRNLARRIS